jgi:hypothetical protein
MKWSVSLTIGGPWAWALAAEPSTPATAMSTSGMRLVDFGLTGTFFRPRGAIDPRLLGGLELGKSVPLDNRRGIGQVTDGGWCPSQPTRGCRRSGTRAVRAAESSLSGTEPR